MSWIESLSQKLSDLSEADFEYIETNDINDASKLDLGCSGIYKEATIIYFEIKNLHYLLKEYGRRKVAQAYTMFHETLSSISEQVGGFVNCFSSSGILVVFPGHEESLSKAVKTALRISHALSEEYKSKFSGMSGLEFSMGIDHGHIMGTKNPSDNQENHLTWFGSCILKAKRISEECARPYYIGISSTVYHNLDESLRITTRRILGIKKNVEMWSKITYSYENVKKHLYQTNHKISLEEE